MQKRDDITADFVVVAINRRLPSTQNGGNIGFVRQLNINAKTHGSLEGAIDQTYYLHYILGVHIAIVTVIVIMQPSLNRKTHGGCNQLNILSALLLAPISVYCITAHKHCIT